MTIVIRINKLVFKLIHFMHLSYCTTALLQFILITFLWVKIVKNGEGEGRIKWIHVVRLLTSISLLIVSLLLLDSSELQVQYTNMNLNNLIGSYQKPIPIIYSAISLILSKSNHHKLTAFHMNNKYVILTPPTPRKYVSITFYESFRYLINFRQI